MDANQSFAAGQEWSYQARTQDLNSTLLIGALEDHPELGRIVHIEVGDVRVRNPHAEGGYSTVIGHIPMSEAALRNSVSELLASGQQVGQVAEGIQTWREAQGGVFTVSVSEAVQYIEDALVGGEPVRE
jgi:hypothetical protein